MFSLYAPHYPVPVNTKGIIIKEGGAREIGINLYVNTCFCWGIFYMVGSFHPGFSHSFSLGGVVFMENCCKKWCRVLVSLTFLFFLWVSATYCTCAALSEKRGGFTLNADNNSFKNLNEMKMGEMVSPVAGMRRLLSGPGSWPPRCTSKCGRCTPCQAVHVAVPPGARLTTEYYPEAWRCKCGNKLYMP